MVAMWLERYRTSLFSSVISKVFKFSVIYKNVSIYNLIYYNIRSIFFSSAKMSLLRCSRHLPQILKGIGANDRALGSGD